jgi:CBS domain-containing protein
MEVKDIIKPTISINENTSFYEVIQVMVRKQTNSLLVVNDEGVLVGEIGMSDILDAVVPEYLDGDSVSDYFSGPDMFDKAILETKETLTKDFMSTDIHPVETKDSLMSVAALAIATGRTHIPVIDADSRPVGVISRRGVKHIIAHALNIPDEE